MQCIIIFSVAQQPKSGIGNLTGEVPRSQKHIHTHTHPVDLLWTSDKLVAAAATYTTQQTNIYALGGIHTLDPLDRTATRITRMSFNWSVHMKLNK
jgi:hypothetical protein